MNKIDNQNSGKNNEGGASVVGEVKVSNETMSFTSFKKIDSTIPNAASILNGVKFESNPTKPINKFDWKSIKPVGDGEMVDVVIIGAGPGGYTAGEFLSKSGLKTVVVEKEYAGGVCLNVGCIPTKALLKSAHVLEIIRHADEYGVDVDVKNLKLNWNKMLKRKDDVSLSLRNSIEILLKSANAELVKGTAEIIDRYNVKVKDRLFTTKIIVIASGSTPIMLPLEGFKEAHERKILIDSTDALSLSSIPKSFVVIGGGVIGIEFASLYNELGSKVTVIEGGPSILGPLDKDVKKFTIDKIQRNGINVITNAKVISMDGNKVYYEIDGKKHFVEGEKVLLSIGRRPNNLGLDKTLGIEVDKRGSIIANNQLQTNIDNIFAIGDVIGQSMLAHTAYKHAHVVVNFINGKAKVCDMNKVPACVYTSPELASIGRTEDQLIADGVSYISSVWQNKNVGKVLADGDTEGFTKLLVSKDTGEILGAHIINKNASDMIAEIATLMELEGTVYELADTIHPHPSISEVIYEAAVHAKLKLESKK